jgi:hypothetical protein
VKGKNTNTRYPRNGHEDMGRASQKGERIVARLPEEVMAERSGYSMS